MALKDTVAGKIAIERGKSSPVVPQDIDEPTTQKEAEESGHEEQSEPKKMVRSPFPRCYHPGAGPTTLAGGGAKGDEGSACVIAGDAVQGITANFM